LPLIAFVHVSTCHGTIIRENITIATFQLHAHAHGNTSHLNKSNALFPGGSVDPFDVTNRIVIISLIITWRIKATEPSKKFSAFTTKHFGVHITRVQFGVDLEN